MRTHLQSILLGVTGLAVAIASWMSQPPAALWGALSAVAICALGGLLPVRLAGLRPLPASLPLIGALAVGSAETVAMTGGLLSGLATALSPGRRDGTPGSSETTGAGILERWLGGFGLGGLLAVTAALASRGFAGLGGFGAVPATRLDPSASDTLRLLVIMSVCILLAVALSGLVVPGRSWTWRRVLFASAASVGWSGAALALQAVIRLAGEPPVLACLGSALAAALLLSPRLSRLARQRDEAERRSRTGLTLVEAIALAIEAKDSTSERHLLRMRIYAVGVARRLGMLPHEVEALEYAALLHDVGKLVVPEAILTKPVSLSEEESERMAAHAKVGAEILETTPLSSQVAEMVRHHHERYDGTGYPAGLTGVEIPIGSRILSAVDCFEALTSERPYRHGMPVREVIDYLRRNSGVLFDPRVVRTLLDAHAELEQEVLEEERARAAVRPQPGAAVQRTGGGAAKEGRQPVQNVLDGIATSHMDVYSLHQISQALGKTLDLEECFALIAGRLRRMIHFESAAIYVMDSENDVLRPRYATGAGSAEILGLTIPMGQALSGWAARQKHSLIGVAADPEVGPSRRDASRSDLEPLAGSAELARLRSSLVAPLLEGHTLVGVIALYDRAERGYTTQEERLLSQMAGQVAGAIRACLLFEQTQEHALTDSLTGLPNSRYMSIAFEREAARAREQGAPLTLMVMDIDNFRGINDDFGHQAGDRFLIGMARAIRSQMRVCDSCIRYSGDEFVAILPGLAGLEVEAVAERLMEVARDYCLETRPGRPAGTSLSIGWATMPEDGEQFAALLDRAAGRMRENKQRRRNGIDEGCSARPADHLMRGTRH